MCPYTLVHNKMLASTMQHSTHNHTPHPPTTTNPHTRPPPPPHQSRSTSNHAHRPLDGPGTDAAREQQPETFTGCPLRTQQHAEHTTHPHPHKEEASTRRKLSEQHRLNVPPSHTHHHPTPKGETSSVQRVWNQSERRTTTFRAAATSPFGATP